MKLGPYDQANSAHFRVYFNTWATCFTFPIYDANKKANQTNNETYQSF